MGLGADLEAVEGVGPLAEACAGLGILAGVHDMVPEVHREALLRFDQRKHLHSYVGLVQRCGACDNHFPGRIRMRASDSIKEICRLEDMNTSDMQFLEREASYAFVRRPFIWLLYA